jgi:hypothetical protein
LTGSGDGFEAAFAMEGLGTVLKTTVGLNYDLKLGMQIGAKWEHTEALGRHQVSRPSGDAFMGTLKLQF